jgi:DNA invertase Pin-like site-specific DNA recombinase
VSGKVRASVRPAFADMMKTFERVNGRKRLAVTKIDRLGRDAEDILATVRLLAAAGVEVFVLQLGQIDLSSPTGRLVLTVLGGVAEMERTLIVERTNAGLARARAQGKRLGRPRALQERERADVVAALVDGASINGLAKKYGVSRGTIRALKAAA